MDNLIVKEIRRQIALSIEALNLLSGNEDTVTQLQLAVELCITCLKGGNKILLIGNGGSAADAQHIAGEFVSRFAFDRPGLPAIALTTDTSILTAIGNDYGYDNVFSRQLQAIANAGDILIAYSTSGRSKNVLVALEQAKTNGVKSIGMTGAQADEMKGLCTVCIQVPSRETPRIQECHAVLGHIICGLVEKRLFNRE